MKLPIAEILSRIRPFKPCRKAAHLSGYIAWEKFNYGHSYSTRIGELESALRQIVHRDLEASNREARKRAS